MYWPSKRQRSGGRDAPIRDAGAEKEGPRNQATGPSAQTGTQGGTWIPITNSPEIQRSRPARRVLEPPAPFRSGPTPLGASRGPTGGRYACAVAGPVRKSVYSAFSEVLRDSIDQWDTAGCHLPALADTPQGVSATSRSAAALVHECWVAVQVPHPRKAQLATFSDVGHASSRIRFSALQASTASIPWLPRTRARSRPPNSVL